MLSVFTKKPKAQLLFIHGGMTFSRRADYLAYLKNRPVSLEQKKYWSVWLQKKLSRNTQVIIPKMPRKENAYYDEWKLHFENHLPLLNKPFILIGNSLGGIFLARYLSENKLKRKAQAIYLVAPPFDNSLPGEDLTNGFKLPKDLSLLEKNTKKLTLLFSEQDEIVPPSQAKKYENKLQKADIILYKDIPGHFFIETFPELLADINKTLSLIKR